MKVNVVNGRDQIIDTIDVDECYITKDYINDCMLNGCYDDETLEEFKCEIAGMCLQDPDTGYYEDLLVEVEEDELIENFMIRRGLYRVHIG